MNRRYILTRLGQAGFTLWAVVTLTFVLIRFLPGDPRTFLAAMSIGRNPSSVATSARIEAAGIDPGAGLLEQYMAYMGALLQGDLGQSLYHNEPVLDVVLRALPWTLFVVAVALPVTFLLGVGLGALMAYWEGTRFDVVTSVGATLLTAIPYYILAILMLWPLGYLWGLFPVRGHVPQGVEPGFTLDFLLGVLHHGALPIVSLVLTGFGFIALSMRANSIQILGEGYVRVANLRGLPDRRIALQYVGRNAILPLYTGFLIAIGFALGGTVVLEQIFQYHGLGFTLVRAVTASDYPLMMATFILITTIVVVGLVVADFTYGLIDPRASVDRESNGAGVPVRVRLRGWLRGLVGLPRRSAGRLRRLAGSVLGRKTDRGAAARGHSLFEATADVTLSRRERARRWADEYLRAPARIMWSDWKARIGLVIVAVYVLMGTVGPRLVAKPVHGQGPSLVGPFQTLAHPLGTDIFGQDLLSLMVHGTPALLAMIVSGAVFATTVATVVGLLSGYAGGSLDRGLTLLSDLALTIPGLPLVIVLVAVLQPESAWVIGVLLVINAWGGIARQIRSQVLVVREEPYVEASGVMSLSTATILGRDILPNVAPYVLINAINVGRQVIVASVALQFLGILTSVGDAHWGAVLDDAYSAVAFASPQASHWIAVPMVTISLFVLGLILLTQSLDRVFNPRVRTRHATHTAGGEDVPDSVAAAGGD